MITSTQLRDVYQKLENDTITTINKLIEEQGIESNFNSMKCLPITVSYIDGDIVELQNSYRNPIFINKNGMHFDWDAICSIEDLIELISEYENKA